MRLRAEQFRVEGDVPVEVLDGHVDVKAFHEWLLGLDLRPVDATGRHAEPLLDID